MRTKRKPRLLARKGGETQHPTRSRRGATKAREGRTVAIDFPSSDENATTDREYSIRFPYLLCHLP